MDLAWKHSLLECLLNGDFSILVIQIFPYKEDLYLHSNLFNSIIMSYIPIKTNHSNRVNGVQEGENHKQLRIMKYIQH